jgi:hypothetical protein
VGRLTILLIGGMLALVCYTLTAPNAGTKGIQVPRIQRSFAFAFVPLRLRAFAVKSHSPRGEAIRSIPQEAK